MITFPQNRIDLILSFQKTYNRFPSHAERLALLNASKEEIQKAISNAAFGADNPPVSRYVSDRKTLVEAFKAVHKREPSIREAQIIQSIGEHESNWGRGWIGPGVGSNNVGAIQATSAPSFIQNDSHANGNVYSAQFRVYPTLEKGAEDLVRHLTIIRPTVWAKIKSGDYMGTVTAMHNDKPIYYEAPIASYYQAVIDAARKIAPALHEVVVTPRWYSVVALGIVAIPFLMMYGIKRMDVVHGEAKKD
jgi:hypothetical protein